MIPLKKPELTDRQARFIAALLEADTMREAERKANVAHRTAWRWYQDATFQAAWRLAQRKAYGQALSRLQAAALKAVNYLVGTLSPDAKPDSVKVRAAGLILEHAAGGRVIEEFSERLAALEQERTQQEQPRKWA